MPLNDDGHWWELADESRGGTPYYYHTKTGETQWTRPEGFVIPLGIIQTTTSLGRRLSQNTFGRTSQVRDSMISVNSDRRLSLNRRSRSYGDPSAERIEEEDDSHGLHRRPSTEYVSFPPMSKSGLLRGANPLTPIPGSPDATSISNSTPSTKRSRRGEGSPSSGSGEGELGGRTSPSPRRPNGGSLHRAVSSPVVTTGAGHQSFAGAVEEMIAEAREEKKRGKGKGKEKEKKKEASGEYPEKTSSPISPSKSGRIHFPGESHIQRALKDAANVPPSPKRTLPAIPPTQSPEKEKEKERARKSKRDADLPPEPNVNGKDIGAPLPDPGMNSATPIGDRD